MSLIKIIAYIIDKTYDDYLTFICRTKSDKRIILKVVDFKPFLYIENRKDNLIFLSEYFYTNNINNQNKINNKIKIEKEILNINACEKKEMLKIYMNNKQDIIDIQKHFQKRDVKVYNCTNEYAYQYFNTYKIDPSLIILITYNDCKQDGEYITYYTTINGIKNVSIQDHDDMIKDFPIHVIGFDIEVKTNDETKFPSALNIKDEIIAISSIRYKLNDIKNIETNIYYISRKYVLSEDEMNKRKITNQYIFSQEKGLVHSFIRELYKHDIIFDFNGTGFDIPYILNRMKLYSIKIQKHEPVSINLIYDKLKIIGIIHIDILSVYKSRDADKNKENNLNFLSMKYLRQPIDKIIDDYTIECLPMKVEIGMTCDITYEIIEDIIRENYNGKIEEISYIEIDKEKKILIRFDKKIPNNLNENITPKNIKYISLVKDDFRITDIRTETFKDMLLYCVNDTRLTYYLMEIKNYIIMYMQKSLIRNCLLHDSAMCGNSYLNQLMLTKGLIESKWAIETPFRNEIEIHDKYEGAIVIPPKAGKHENVYVLDFNSLYPSIIIAYNICLTTLVREDVKKRNNINDNDLISLIVEDEQIYYYKPEIKKGILPEYCSKFLKTRKEINEYIKSTKLDPTTYMILDLRQKNIKVSNNSIYGSLGYEKNLHFNKYVAASVSKLGRDNLTRVREYFEECGHDIVGGDTDSIFVLKNNDEFYNQLDEYNKMIPPPLHIAEEKKYSILFLSTKKKRRFGIIKNKLEIKGYMTIRRDTALILKEVEQKVFDIILNNNNYGEKILEYCKNLIIENEDFDKFSITKTLKNTTEYRNISSPHCFLAKKLLNIGLLESIKSGDKIKYVHVKENWSNEIQTKNTGVRYCVATKELMKIKNLNIDYTKYRKDIYNMLWSMLEDVYDEKYGILLEKYLIK